MPRPKHTKPHWIVATSAVLLVSTVAGAQGFSCIDACLYAIGRYHTVEGKEYSLSHCSSIYHDGHHHVDCYYVG